MRAAAFLAVVLGACDGPPGGIARDAMSAEIDAAPGPGPDAAHLADAAAPGADAALQRDPDAGIPFDPANPFGIRLVDVSDLAFDEAINGGAAANDVWAVGAGAAIGDVDGDGRLDLVLSRIDDPASMYAGGPSRLMINDGGLHFTADPAFEAMFAGIIAHAAALGDIDGDGDLDLFIGANGADFLLENDGGGHFVDVTTNAGVAGMDGDVTIGAMFVDVNRDGLLDLYVSQNTNSLPFTPNALTRNRLHLNLGDGTFVDVSDESGADSTGSTQASLAFDLRGTGDLDLYVANDGSPGDAWYTLASIDDRGVPTYVDSAPVYGVNTPRASMGVGLADIDRNLLPDLYVSNWGDNALYLNNWPAVPLTPAAVPAGLRVGADAAGVPQISWGVRFVDLDRDGNHEVYVATGGVTPVDHCLDFRQLDWFLRQPARATPFENITKSVGLRDTPECGDLSVPIAGRGLVTGDLDGDGDDDLVLTPFIERYRVYENVTPAANHAVRVRLVGRVSAPDPIGARLHVVHLDGRHDVAYRFAGGDTYSQSDGVLELGLGAATGVSSAWIEWPSGLVQQIVPPVDVEATFVEPAWLTLSARVADVDDGAPVVTYVAVGPDGAPLGAAGAGRSVVIERSDGVATTVVDHANGSYTAELPHPGAPRRTVLTISVDGVPARARPMLSYR